jgi:hypothetical protein
LRTVARFLVGQLAFFVARLCSRYHCVGSQPPVTWHLLAGTRFSGWSVFRILLHVRKIGPSVPGIGQHVTYFEVKSTVSCGGKTECLLPANYALRRLM